MKSKSNSTDMKKKPVVKEPVKKKTTNVKMCKK